jgi:NAD(P)-dependent dehydrogenase (short-subunit alcohol dehydrogenase family)
LNTSLKAGIELLRLVSAKPVAAPGASHVQIASVAAHCGQGGFAAYGAAKGGMVAAMRALAVELAGRGVRINTVSPGWVRTEMTTPLEAAYPEGVQSIAAHHPLGLGAPSDVTGLVLFLLSAEARWITGADFVVDGGYSCK